MLVVGGLSEHTPGASGHDLSGMPQNGLGKVLVYVESPIPLLLQLPEGMACNPDWKIVH